MRKGSQPIIQTIIQRLDRYLVEQNLVESREKAQRLIKGRLVQVNDQIVTKAAYQVGADDQIRLLGRLRYVGRGGLKLEAALLAFAIDISGLTVLDVGASTGGLHRLSAPTWRGPGLRGGCGPGPTGRFPAPGLPRPGF